MEPATTHLLSGKKIVVAGAGMAGLSFVISLHRHWPSGIPPPKVTVYDRDPVEVSAGREGYSLSISGDGTDSGLYTLNQLGLLDQVLAHSIIGNEAGTGSFKVWTETWRELISVRLKAAPGLPTPGVRIARKDLRRILLDAVAQTGTAVRWGASCVSVSPADSGDGRVRVKILLDGANAATNADHGRDRAGEGVEKQVEEVEHDVDLLVAADGASSKLRGTLRPHDGLRYAGAVQMGGIARYDSASALPSPLDSNFGGVLTGRGVFVFFSPVSPTEIVWALSVREDAPRGPFNNKDPDQVRQMLEEARKLGESIGGVWPEVLEKTVPETTLLIPARDKSPFKHDFKSQENVVFIGDSNHAVSPFAGNGANLALRDGWDLAEQLCRSNTLVEAVGAYDRSSVPRALATLKSSHRRIDMGHSTGLKYLLYSCIFTIGGCILRLTGRR